MCACQGAKGLHLFMVVGRSRHCNNSSRTRQPEHNGAWHAMRRVRELVPQMTQELALKRNGKHNRPAPGRPAAGERRSERGGWCGACAYLSHACRQAISVRRLLACKRTRYRATGVEIEREAHTHGACAACGGALDALVAFCNSGTWHHHRTRRTWVNAWAWTWQQQCDRESSGLRLNHQTEDRVARFQGAPEAAHASLRCQEGRAAAGHDRPG